MSLLAYATGLSLAIVPCDNTALKATIEASIFKINVFSKSTYCSKEAVVSNSLNFSNASIVYALGR